MDTPGVGEVVGGIAHSTAAAVSQVRPLNMRFTQVDRGELHFCTQAFMQ